MVRLTPLGLFAIAAHTAGTLDLEQVARLRIYLIAYGAITAFVTADLFVVLPALIDRSKQLLAEASHPEPEEGSPPEVIVPAFYNFPHAAKLLSLSFVLFAAWYPETALGVADYPRLVTAGIVSLFGAINVSLPFLLDLARVPADTIVPLSLSDTEGYFTGHAERERLDALCLTAERGSFITLLYPAWSVAVRHPLEMRLPLAYPVARHDLEMARFLGLWIDLKRKDGTIQSLYDHWILGRDAKARPPRWSILRNVLGGEG